MGRLMFYLQHRLAALNWSRDDLARAGGPAPATLYKAHNEGRSLSARTLARLEIAVGWEAGSAQRTLDGARPVLQSFEPVDTLIERLDDALERDEGAAVKMIAVELREFLVTVADQLDAFYTKRQAVVAGPR